MAFSNRGPGVTTRSNPKTEYLPMAVENIAKGVVVQTNIAGFATIAVEATTLLGSAWFVTTQALDNSGGSAGDLAIGAVGAGEHVTVTVSAGSATLSPGDPVKIGTDNGEVALYVVGGSADPAGEKIGVYLRREGGTIARAGSTPFAETLTDAGDYGVGTAVAGDVIEIRIGQ